MHEFCAVVHSADAQCIVLVCHFITAATAAAAVELDDYCCAAFNFRTSVASVFDAAVALHDHKRSQLCFAAHADSSTFAASTQRQQ
jgi:hypothetical protein